MSKRKNEKMCNCGNGLFLTARILIPLLFIIDLIGKLMDYSGTVAYIESSGVIFPELFYFASIILLLGGSLSVLFDYKLMWGVSLLILFLIGVNLMFHLNWSQWGQVITFFKNVTMIGGLLALLAYKYKEPHKRHL